MKGIPMSRSLNATDNPLSPDGEQGSGKLPNIVVIGETKKQQQHRCSAREMFLAPWWPEMLKFVESFEHVYVLSAKFRLVPIDEVISPSDAHLEWLGPFERHEWIVAVKKQILLIQPEPLPIITLAASQYLNAMRQMDLPLVVPLAGMSQTQRRRWYERHNRGEIVSMPLAGAFATITPQKRPPATKAVEAAAAAAKLRRMPVTMGPNHHIFDRP